ncbi:MAG: hypothetical protein LBD04_02510 [Synergistaceae bacterium]|nr:hypothetical protein [Synergistaceae bacterium]
MKKGLIALTVVLMALFLFMTAEAGMIQIKNNTGVELVEVFIADSGASDWEEDVLGSNTLPVGDSLTVSSSYSKFDLKVTDGEDALEFYGLDGKAASIVLNGDGTASYP